MISVSKLERILNPAVRHRRQVNLADRGCDRLQRLQVTRKVDGSANCSRCPGSKRIDVSRVPIHIVQQTVMNHIRHAEPDTAVISQFAQSARVKAMNNRSIGPRIVLSINTAIDYLRIHACAADILPNFIHNQDVDFGGRQFSMPKF